MTLTDAAVVVPSAPRPRPAIVTLLAPERHKVQFTVSPETFDKLRPTQDLLRHAIPDGDLAAIFDRALTVLLADLKKRPNSRRHRDRGREANRIWFASYSSASAALSRLAWCAEGRRVEVRVPSVRPTRDGPIRN
jgi:hypothetical protein